jgi:hypothetical protein
MTAAQFTRLECFFCLFEILLNLGSVIDHEFEHSMMSSEGNSARGLNLKISL